MLRATHKNAAKDISNAKGLRRQQTEAEEKLWRAMRKVFLKSKIKVRRQHPIHPYIVDFACLNARLVIEIDGFSHDVNWIYDQKRSTYLEQIGYRVLRFSNDDVGSNLEGVVKTIEQAVKCRENV